MRRIDENKANEVLEFVKGFQKEQGRSPSYRQIVKACHLSSLAVAQRILLTLQSRGLIERDNIGKIVTPTNISKGETILAPLVGVIACGEPILAVENIEETFALPVAIFGRQDLISLRAQGDSMIDAGIHDGDLVFYAPCPQADDGEIVVALIDDSATIKTYYKKNNKVILHPENKEYKDIIVEDCKIRGIVKHVIHSF